MATVVPLGPWIGDSLQKRSAQHAAVQRLQSQGAQFTKDRNQAHRSADASGGTIYSIPPAPAPGTTYWVYAIVSPSGSGGPAGSGAGSGAALPGQVAANASLKQFTGGGTQNIGATNIAGAGIAVVGEFLGANFQAADTKQPEGTSPDTMNMEGMALGGALSPRPGLIALWPKRNDTSNAVTAAYGGRSINILSPAFNQSHHMTVISAYDRSSLIGTSLNSTVVARVKRMKPLWHPQHDVSKVLPKIKLTDSNATGGIAFNVSMPPTYRKNAPQVASVDQLIVRVSRTTYPRDRDGKDDTASRLASNTSAYNYVTYDGTSTVVTDRCSMVSTGATVFYSVWAGSKLHVTPRASFRLVVK